MNKKRTFAHTAEPAYGGALDLLVAALPVLVWSVFLFGARVITISLLCTAASAAADTAAAFLLRRRLRADPYAAVFGLLAAFTLPAAVPFYVALFSGALCGAAMHIRLYKHRRSFCPYILSAAVTGLVFRGATGTFTRPFAYFGAFDMIVDPRLIRGYRVISPLQYMANGNVYEDGIYAQLYGYASGNLGEIAVCALFLALAWLAVRKRADIASTAAMLVTVILLALALPSADAESNFYAFSLLFSGAIVFISVFALNDPFTAPATKQCRRVCAVICGAIAFVLRRYSGAGFETAYYALLAVNVLSPWLERFLLPRPLGKGAKRN